jgi:hypothetical protein
MNTLTVSKGTVPPLVKVWRSIEGEQDEDYALSLQADQLKVSIIIIIIIIIVWTFAALCNSCTLH